MKEWDKIRQMSPKDKWEYFKSYYLIHTVIGAILLILAVFFIRDMKLSGREVLASGCFVNVTIDEDGFLFLTDGYIDFCGKSVKEATALLSADNELNFMPENPLDTASYEMALTAQMFSGEFQYMVLDEAAWEYFQKLDVYADLTEILTPSQQKEYADKMVYQTYQDEDGEQIETVTALDLTGTGFAVRYHLEPQTAYLIFTETAQEKDADLTAADKQRLIDYILAAD